MKKVFILLLVSCLLLICFSGMETHSTRIAFADSAPTEPTIGDTDTAPKEILPEEMLASQPATPKIEFNETASKKDIEDYEKILSFQKEVVPILEESFNEVFPNSVGVEEGNSTQSFDSNQLNELTDYYFDNSNTDDLKVVFVVAKEDENEMKILKEILKTKLKEKVTFEKAKKSIKEFVKMQEEVVDFIDDTYKGQFTVGYDVEKQTIDVELPLTDNSIPSLIPPNSLNNSEISELENNFGSDFINITFTDSSPMPTLARNYPFTNIGGGQQIRLHNPDPTKDSVCSSGYVAYKNNQAFLVTAGHCLNYASPTQSTYKAWAGNATNGTKTFGYEHWSGYNASTRYDLGLIRLTNLDLYVTSRFYTDANNGGINGQLKPYLTVGESGIKKGLLINKSGFRTGITGSTITNVSTTASYGAGFTVAVIRSELRSGTGRIVDGYAAVAGQGDSGGTVYRASDYALVGVQSGIPDREKIYQEIAYDDEMFTSPAWYANSVLGAIYQYTATYDTAVSKMQGQ
ncbi:S1 family peptidase [Saccharibacillus sacchari]|uniref:S1 family peptidase n=1 Tax=Saccharibacillus sacchari TaxID=456493 RepID=A0ACC6PEH5_9BACL